MEQGIFLFLSKKEHAVFAQNTGWFAESAVFVCTETKKTFAGVHTTGRLHNSD